MSELRWNCPVPDCDLHNLAETEGELAELSADHLLDHNRADLIEAVIYLEIILNLYRENVRNPKRRAIENEASR